MAASMAGGQVTSCPGRLASHATGMAGWVTSTFDGAIPGGDGLVGAFPSVRCGAEELIAE